MAGQSTLDASAQDTNTFYRRTLHVLSDAAVPFLVGGSHAFLEYTGIVRNTKDFDLFLRRERHGRARWTRCADAGYRTELTFPHWLGKAWQHDDFVDLVFSSGNGMCRVDDGWFDHAVETQVLGMPVKIVPCEELLWQKAFVMERERFDGADIMHILRARAERLDWDRLIARFGDALAAAVHLPRVLLVRLSERGAPAARRACSTTSPSGIAALRARAVRRTGCARARS